MCVFRYRVLKERQGHQASHTKELESIQNRTLQTMPHRDARHSLQEMFSSPLERRK